MSLLMHKQKTNTPTKTSLRRKLTSLFILSQLILSSALNTPLYADDTGNADHLQESFVYTGAKELKQITLQKTLFANKTKTRDVPSTCTRKVQVGEHSTCKDVTEKKCETVPGECRTEQECRSVPKNCRTTSERVCENVPSQECRTVPGQCRNEPVCTNVPDCHTEYERECRNIPRQRCFQVPGACRTRQECRSERVCRTETKQECRPGREHCYQVPVCQGGVCRNVTRCDPPQQECKSVPHQVCVDRPSCRNVEQCEPPRQQCETSYEKECKNVPRERCTSRSVCTNQTRCDEDRRECKTVYNNECRDVPRTQCDYEQECSPKNVCEPSSQKCHNETKPVCTTTPVYKDETYECAKKESYTEKVKTGQIVGQISIALPEVIGGLSTSQTFNMEILNSDEYVFELKLSLDDSELTKDVLLKMNQKVKTNKSLNPQDQTINYTVTAQYQVQAISVEGVLNAFKQSARVFFADNNLLLLFPKIEFPAAFSLDLELENIKKSWLGNDSLWKKDLTFSSLSQLKVMDHAEGSVVVVPIDNEVARDSLLKTNALLKANFKAGDYLNGQILPSREVNLAKETKAEVVVK